jgi:S1-C subfamily serine protease
MERWLALGFVGLVLLGCNMSQDRPGKGIVAEAVASSVQIFAERDGARRAGSAVVLTSDVEAGRSLVLTSAHLLTPMVAQEIHLLLVPGGERVPARLLAIDEDADIALLESARLPLRPVRLRDTGGLGDAVWVVAYPWGRDRTVVRGVISQIQPPPFDAGEPFATSLETDGPVRLIDASVSYGMSGGGVFHAGNGGLLGLVRGYRTAQMALPGGGERLVLPVAGETTVIHAGQIVCFLRAEGFERLVAAALSGKACG